MRFCFILLLALGCGQEAPEAPVVPIAPGTPTAGALLPSDMPPPAVENACVVGRWQANDFLATLRQSLRRDLRDARLTHASGTIQFELSAPEPNGAGALVATADELVHRATLGQGGLRVTATHSLDGASTMSYRLMDEGQMLILPPTDGELSGTVSWRVVVGKARRGRRQSDTARVNIAGLYIYECTPERLTIRRINAPGDLGETVVLDRVVE